MTRSIRRPRRAALLLGGRGDRRRLLLSGCGAGPDRRDRATWCRPISGRERRARRTTALSLLRNLAVVYNGPEGYPAGSDAPLEVAIYNDTTQPVTVTVTTASARASCSAAAWPRPQPDAATAAPSAPATASGRRPTPSHR